MPTVVKSIGENSYVMSNLYAVPGAQLIGGFGAVDTGAFLSGTIGSTNLSLKFASLANVASSANFTLTAQTALSYASGRLWGYTTNPSPSYTLSVSSDVSAYNDASGTSFPITITTQSSNAVAFTYAGVSRSFAFVNSQGIVAPASGDFAYFIAPVSGVVTKTNFACRVDGVTPPEVFKAFDMPVTSSGYSIILGYDYLSGSQIRFVNVVLDLQHLVAYRVDWAPSGVSNSTFDQTIDTISLDAFGTLPFSAFSAKWIKTPLGFFGKFVDDSNIAHYLQIDPTLSYYREIAFTGAGSGDALFLFMFPDANGNLLSTDSASLNIIGADPTTPPLTFEFPKVRAFGFSLDDHDFYVINLNDDETLIYDCETKQWCSWYGATFDYWRANYGVNWQGISQATVAAGTVSDVIVGDSETGTLWALDPTQGYDQQPAGSDVDAINSVFITGVPTRGDATLKADKVFLSMETGFPGISPGIFNLRTSDDNGQTFNDEGSVTLTDGDTNQVVQWLSLGAINAPGKLFEFSDNGASVRIDGCDINIRGVDK